MTDGLTLTIGLIILAYLLGSIPTAVFICKALNIPDPRYSGSQNPGATNVLRIGNPKAALLTLGGDILKGIIAMLPSFAFNASDSLPLVCGVAVVTGHIFPIYHLKKGGKGIATSLGVCITLNLLLALCLVGIWLFVIAVGRISSLASISTALLSPLATLLIMPEYTGAIFLIATLLICSHRKNIKGLLAGTETRL